MLLLESGDALAFDIKAGGPLELALVPKGRDPVTHPAFPRDFSRASPTRRESAFTAAAMKTTAVISPATTPLKAGLLRFPTGMLSTTFPEIKSP